MSDSMLSSDDLSSAFGFLDVGDVPAVARVSKDWVEALDAIEETLWLSLVRKHHPVVEKITNMLPADVVDEPPAKRIRIDDQNDAAAPVAAAIPAPSRNWKRQFQRAHMIARQDDAQLASREEEPRPLSSYFFQVDLILYSEVKDTPRTKVGVVSTIVDDASFMKHDHGRIYLSVKDMDEVSKHTFTAFEIKVAIFEKSTGKQATLYRGALEEHYDFNRWDFDIFRVSNMFGHRQTAPLPRGPGISCCLHVAKDGCICNCCDGEDLELFALPHSYTCDSCSHNCNCCSCGKPWQCYWDLDLTLVIGYYEYDFNELTTSEQLQFLESLDFA